MGGWASASHAMILTFFRGTGGPDESMTEFNEATDISNCIGHSSSELKIRKRGYKSRIPADIRLQKL